MLGLHQITQMNVKANQQKRTFTIRVNGSKFRSIKFSKEDFEELEYNTSADWHYFLARSNSYYYIN
jgi:hypothetical protein